MFDVEDHEGCGDDGVAGATIAPLRLVWNKARTVTTAAQTSYYYVSNVRPTRSRATFDRQDPEAGQQPALHLPRRSLPGPRSTVGLHRRQPRASQRPTGTPPRDEARGRHRPNPQDKQGRRQGPRASEQACRLHRGTSQDWLRPHGPSDLPHLGDRGGPLQLRNLRAVHRLPSASSRRRLHDHGRRGLLQVSPLPI